MSASTDRLEILRRLAADTLEVDRDLEPSSRLVEDLGLDSIRLLTLAVAVEDHFGICLDADDEAALVTVADLLAVVERKQHDGHV